MAKITLFEDDAATMWYHPDSKIVHHKIRKFIYGQKFYDFIFTGTNALKKYGAHKWLSDDRDLPVLRTEDMEWGAANWFPKTVEAGWKYWAIVEPEAVMGHMNLEDLKDRYSKGGVITQFFTDIDEAMHWLESQN